VSLADVFRDLNEMRAAGVVDRYASDRRIDLDTARRTATALETLRAALANRAVKAP
jgi:hypothetical protein